MGIRTWLGAGWAWEDRVRGALDMVLSCCRVSIITSCGGKSEVSFGKEMVRDDSSELVTGPYLPRTEPRDGRERGGRCGRLTGWLVSSPPSSPVSPSRALRTRRLS